MKARHVISTIAVVLTVVAGAAKAQTTDLRRLQTKNDALAWEAVGRLDIGGAGHCYRRRRVSRVFCAAVTRMVRTLCNSRLVRLKASCTVRLNSLPWLVA